MALPQEGDRPGKGSGLADQLFVASRSSGHRLGAFVPQELDDQAITPHPD